jgi:cytosine/creatinine deaminase
LFTREGELLSRGRNRRVQQGDPSIHGETDAFRRAGRQRSYRNLVMVTTLAPCWYCSGLVRQFRIGTLVVGDSRTFAGGLDWLRENGVEVIDLDNRECRELMEGSSPGILTFGTKTSAKSEGCSFDVFLAVRGVSPRNDGTRG